MNNISSSSPEEFVDKTDSDFFQIVCVAENDYRLWNGVGSINMLEGSGFLETKVFSKKELVKEYYKALSFFKNEAQFLTNGKLEIVALPKYKVLIGTETEIKDEATNFSHGLNTKLQTDKY